MGAQYQDFAASFYVEKSIVYSIFHDPYNAIIKTFSIEFPINDETKLESISSGFERSRKGGSPLFGCVDASDGILISIRGPKMTELVKR